MHRPFIGVAKDSYRLNPHLSSSANHANRDLTPVPNKKLLDHRSTLYVAERRSKNAATPSLASSPALTFASRWAAASRLRIGLYASAFASATAFGPAARMAL